VYRVQTGTTGGPPGSPGTSQLLAAEDVIHVPGLTPDGSVGYRLLTIARESIGFGLAAQRYGCSLFRNLGRPGGVVSVPATVKLNEEGRENIKRSFRQDHGGENVGTVALMEQGFTFTPLEFATNQQTQYQQILNFFVYEVARMLNVPPFKIHSLDEATWNNAGAQQRSFVNDTLRPWLEKWESEIEKKLLLPGEKGRYYVEFDTDCLLRGDDAVRYQSYASASGNAAWLTVNEIRERENLPPVEGGDVLPSTKPAPQQPVPGQQQAPDQKPKKKQPGDEKTDDQEQTNEGGTYE
jgi:HK97 family phage portal protein